MKEDRSPRSFPGRFGGEGCCSSGNLKVYESKKEKKRPRLIVSDSDVDSDSDDDLLSRRVVDRGRLSISSKKNRVDDNEDIDSRRKVSKSGASRVKEAGIGKKEIHESSVISKSADKRKVKVLEFEEEGDSISDAIKRYKDAKHDLKRTSSVRIDREKDRTVMNTFSKSDDVNMKKTKTETKKLEESEETTGTRGLGPKYAVSSTKSRKEETKYIRSSFGKRPLSNSLANDSSVAQGSQQPDCFSGRTLKLEHDDNDELVGESGEKFVCPSDRSIRVQGKSGVLKLMPKNRTFGDFQNTCQKEMEKNVKKSVSTVKCEKDKLHKGKKINAAMRIPRNHMSKCLPNGKTKAQLLETENADDSSGMESGGADSGSFKTDVKCKREMSPLLVRSLLHKSKGEPKNGLEKAKLKKLSVREEKVKERLGSDIAKPKNHENVFPSNGKRKIHDLEKEEDCTSSGTEARSIDLGGSGREIKSKGESRSALVRRTNSDGNRKELNDKGSCSALLGLLKKDRGSQKGRQTEKQLLRDYIKNMLLNVGWTIDMRPRRGRTYSDNVYISPTGTEYWSITKAYYALEKQFNCQGNADGASSSFSAIPGELLNMLTRKTVKKKIREEKEKRKMLRLEKASKDVKQGVKLKIRKKWKVGSSVRPEVKYPKVRIKAKGFIEISEEAGKPTSTHVKGIPKRAGSHNNTSLTSDNNLLQGRKNKKQRGYALLVRSSNKGMDPDGNGSSLFPGKLTVLSWLIDSGTVPENGKVQYMNKRRTRAMLDGWVTREGIHCSCCSKILTVSKFEIHAGSKLRQPFQNIFVETGVSLLQCQLEAWDLQEEAEQKAFHFVETDGDDPYDDTCAICGDGGDLICCDSCPSTFHQNCLNIKMLPPGEWHCPNCVCIFCGLADVTDSPMSSCSQCERKYHQVCVSEVDATAADSNHHLSTSFCGRSCRKLFERLQRLLGVKNELEGGCSWTLIQRLDENSERFPRGLALRAELNSKLAVALAVMDECFLPIVDRRSGINLIHNVIYNCGSNFNRLNFTGFYTIILEKGDEFISAASIRIHGTRLAEMPFIGTRNMYRRQGMCRRLLNAIELVLCTLNVDILVIPAISELMHTWTQVFGFGSLQDEHRQEMRSSNMLVFPGTDMLEKSLLKQDPCKGGDMIDNAVVKTNRIRSSDGSIEVPNLSPETSSGALDVHVSEENAVLESRREMENRDAATGISLGVSDEPTYGTCSMADNPSDTAHGSNFQIDDTGVIDCVKPYAVTPEIINQSSDAASEFACQTSGEGIACRSVVHTSEYHIQATGNNKKDLDGLKSPESSSVGAFIVSSDKAHNFMQVIDKVSECSDVEPSQSFEASPVKENKQASEEGIFIAHNLTEMKDGNTALEFCSPDAMLIRRISKDKNSDASPGASVLSYNVHVVELGTSAIKLKADAPEIIVRSLNNNAKCESEGVCGTTTCQNASSFSLPLTPISNRGALSTCEGSMQHDPELVLKSQSTGATFSSSTVPCKKLEAEKLPLSSPGKQLFRSSSSLPVEPNIHFLDEGFFHA